jgi:hypothetical protein
MKKYNPPIPPERGVEIHWVYLVLFSGLGVKENTNN